MLLRMDVLDKLKMQIFLDDVKINPNSRNVEFKITPVASIGLTQMEKEQEEIL